MYEDFLNNLRKKGAFIHPSLEIQETDGERGVYVTASVDERVCIISIPVNLAITTETAKQSRVGKKLSMALHEMREHDGEDILSAEDDCYLAAYILEGHFRKDISGDNETSEETSEAQFVEYYNHFPLGFDQVPLFWSSCEVSELLEGSYLIQLIDERKDNIRFDYDSLCLLLPYWEDECSFERFLWARTVVTTRNFAVEIDGKKCNMLVPIADMLNHSRPRMTTWTFDNNTLCFTVTTVQVLQEGFQVMDSYGRKSNSRYLLNYGFTVLDNRDPDGECNDTCRVFLNLAPSDKALIFVAPMIVCNDGHCIFNLRGLRSYCLDRRCLYLHMIFTTYQIVPLNDGDAEEDNDDNGETCRQVQDSAQEDEFEVYCYGKGVYLMTSYNGQAGQTQGADVLSIARFITAQNTELIMLPRLDDFNCTERVIISTSCDWEKRALMLLRSTALDQVSRYKKDASADVHSFDSTEAIVHQYRRKNSAIVLKSEIEICLYWISLADLCFRIFELWEFDHSSFQAFLHAHFTDTVMVEASKFVQSDWSRNIGDSISCTCCPCNICSNDDSDSSNCHNSGKNEHNTIDVHLDEVLLKYRRSVGRYLNGVILPLIKMQSDRKASAGECIDTMDKIEALEMKERGRSKN